MIEGIKKIREAFKRITAGLKKEDETFNMPTDQMPEKEVIFADGQHPFQVVPEAITKKERIENSLLIQGIIGTNLSKVCDLEIFKANNKRKMDGQPLRRDVAKRKVRKKRRRVSDSDTTNEIMHYW